MRHHVALVTALTLFAGCSTVPTARRSPNGSELTARLAAVVRGFDGTAGVYVRHLGDGRSAELNADATFPTASLVKVPILVALFDRIAAGELEYRAELHYDAQREYPGEDVLARFRDAAPVELAELVTFMATFSDNTASLWCQELAGGGAAINARMEALGAHVTRVNSRTEGRAKEQAEFGWGMTTPREMAELFVAIRTRRAGTRGACDEMERVLSRSYWTGEALSVLPPNVHVLSKQGAVNRSRSEVCLVDAPHGAYVVCVITKDQADESWGRDNAGFQLLRDVSRTCWDFFEPASPWRAGEGAEAFR